MSLRTVPTSVVDEQVAKTTIDQSQGRCGRQNPTSHPATAAVALVAVDARRALGQAPVSRSDVECDRGSARSNRTACPSLAVAVIDWENSERPPPTLAGRHLEGHGAASGSATSRPDGVKNDQGHVRHDRLQRQELSGS